MHNEYFNTVNITSSSRLPGRISSMLPVPKRFAVPPSPHSSTMTAETAFAFYRSLPTAPISATSTKFSSKFTEEQRQLIINVLWWFLTAEKTPEWMRKSTSGDVYSKDIARRLKMVEVKVDHDRAKTVVEIGVEPGTSRLRPLLQVLGVYLTLL